MILVDAPYHTKLHTNFDNFYVTWECTTECNYSCSYCWPSCHNGLYRWPDSSKTDSIIHYLKTASQGKPVIIDIMGGEPTLWPELQRFCQEIFNIGGMATFSSNGSRTVRWWDNFVAPVQELVFSFHSEYASIEHYVDIIKSVQHRYNTTIMILYHPSFKEKCLNAWTTFTANDAYQINVQIKKIVSPNIKYNAEDEQILLYEYWNSKVAKTTYHMDLFMNDMVVSPRNLIASGKNLFYNWSCQLGNNYRYITANGDIFGAACSTARKYHMGNVYNNSSNVDPQIVKCNDNNCGCYVDLVLNTKWHTQE